MKWRHRAPRFAVVDRINFLVQECKGRRVIHIGFAGTDNCREAMEPQGLWLHSRLAAGASSLVGLDVNQEAVDHARQQGYEAYLADCCSSEELKRLSIEPADVVVAGEIIEHLDAPGHLLRAVHGLVRHTEGRLIVTTPNAHALYSGATALARLEIINPDHVALYSWFTLTNLLRRHKWHTTEFLMYDYPDQSGSAIGRAGFAVQRALSRPFPLLAHGLIAVSEPMPE